MDVARIDHLNLRIPEDGVETAVEFYGDALGLGIERLDQLRAGELPFFDVRLTADQILHLWPTPEFEAPTGNGYDHVALVADAPIDDVVAELEAAGVEIDERKSTPLGATGHNPAVYVLDPFGYKIEFKEHARHG